MNLFLLYRGPLSSCNYDCPYCPFAKRRDSRAQLHADRLALKRFAAWIEANPDGHRFTILFTPWGEGLTRSWYRDALTALSHVPHVDRVAIQTNLAGRLAWVAEANPQKLALWATYHPGQVKRDRFLAACATLTGHGIRHSVGIVGLEEHYPEAITLRKELPQDTYLWVNAAEGHTYTAAQETQWTAIDPLFGYSVRPHVSKGHGCWAGESALSVLGDGTVRRCHFIPEPIGNLYDGSYLPALKPRACTNAMCDCHIGYVHLKRLGLHRVFEGGLAERIPVRIMSAASASTRPR